MDKKDFDFDFDFEKEYGIDPNEFSDADSDLFGDDQLDFDLNDPIFDEAPAQPAPQPVQTAPSAQSAVNILEMAQRVKDETIAAAEKKAEEIIAHAKDEAKAKLGTLEDERASLTIQVENLKKSAVDFRDNLAALLKAHQDVLDKTEGLF